MQRLTLVWLLAFSGFGSAASPPALLATEGPLPLATGQAIRLSKQCSRSAPQPEGLLWQPSKQEVAQLESDLPGYLDAAREKRETTPPLPPQYRGQYVSFTSAGAIYIYASYIPESVATQSKAHGQAVVVCDGGIQFSGIVYSGESRQFHDLQFNGPR